MSAQFLLPCPQCEHKIPVSAKHAGGQAVCSGCQTDVDIPKLRDLKLYADDADTSAASSRSTAIPGEQSRAKGLLFALGVLIAIIGSAVGGYVLYSANQKFVRVEFEESLSKVEEKIDSMSPAELYEEWSARPTTLGNWQEFEFIKRNREATVLQTISFIVFGIAGVGLLMVLSSFALK